MSMNDTTAGEVTGGGQYEPNTTIRLIAIPEVGYSVAYWAKVDANGKELAQYYNNPISITVGTASENYVAMMTKNTVEGVAIMATIGGTAKILGDDIQNLEESDTILVVADIALVGYQFDGWYISGAEKLLSTEMSERFALSEVKDKILIARFSQTTNTSTNTETSNE